MLARIGLFVVAAAAALAVLGGISNQAAAADKVVTLSPTSGVVGTLVTAELFNAPPNDPITVIFKIPGDPILTTGTTDADGYAKFTFTVPYVPGGGTYPVFFTDFKCSCQIATDFTVINSRPTPVPTATPTTPPPPTPTTPPTQAPNATPTATPTPGVPVLGTTNGMGGPGPNLGILALGAMAVVTVLAWFGATRRGLAPAEVAEGRSDWADDYSTHLDMATLDSLRRPAVASGAHRRSERGALGWAIGAGVAAITGVLLLRKK